MKRVAAFAACLAIIVAGACASPTAPALDPAEGARRNGGLLGSGYEEGTGGMGSGHAEGGGTVGSGYDDGGFGSGHDSAPGGLVSTGRYGGMAGSGY